MARPRQDAERREQILAALEGFVLREGLGKLTLTKIADEAKLPRPLVRYFAGNRDDLILLLFDRIMDRGEGMLTDATERMEEDLSLEVFLELMFDRVLADPVMNQLVGELWPIAERDEKARARLRSLYVRLCEELSIRMAAEGVGENKQDRFSRAYAVVALGFGHATFAEVAIATDQNDSILDTARGILGLPDKK